jgi:hypothetical protein
LGVADVQSAATATTRGANTSERRCRAVATRISSAANRTTGTHRRSLNRRHGKQHATNIGKQPACTTTAATGRTTTTASHHQILNVNGRRWGDVT